MSVYFLNSPGFLSFLLNISIKGLIILFFAFIITGLLKKSRKKSLVWFVAIISFIILPFCLFFIYQIKSIGSFSNETIAGSSAIVPAISNLNDGFIALPRTLNINNIKEISAIGSINGFPYYIFIILWFSVFIIIFSYLIIVKVRFLIKCKRMD